MNCKSLTLILTFACLGLTTPPPNVTASGLPARVRSQASFDRDWRFFKGDASGAEKPEFVDTAWRALDVPHDWSIEGPFDRANPTGRGGGYLPAGIGWYRKHFALPTDDAGRRVSIQFDGVMANSDVWINGFHLGHRPYGYVSFRCDLTGHLNFGPAATNMLAVRADNSQQPASRYYTGAGIYRHVHLILTDPVHLVPWATVVTTPQVSAAQAVVRVRTTVVNESKAPRSTAVQVVLAAPGSPGPMPPAQTPRQVIAPGQSADFQEEVTVANPQRWDVDHPVLYAAKTRVLADPVAGATDDEMTSFGIREFHFDAATGFWINGENLKIKGVCLHHDCGALGAAVPLAAWERRLRLLKLVGVNAIRTSHNPVAPEFLDLCDRLGFLVMEETFDTWTAAKGSADYGYNRYFKEWWEADTGDTVRRDRNHPSLILYSVGNEIRDNLNSPAGFALFTAQRDLIHRLDPTRPVTMAVFRPNQSHVYDSGFAELMDVVGQNYRENELVAAHRAKPERKVIGTENGHDRQTWLALRDNAFMSGQFLWTGFDYIGESDWPFVVNGAGLFDRIGAAKPLAYQRQSWWSNEPMVRLVRRVARTAAGPVDPGYETVPRRDRQALFRDWTPRDTAAHNENVEVYSNCDEVEFLLNGKSLGSQPRPRDDSPRTWNVAFEPGTLQAVGKNHGQIVARDELRTAGKPAKIALSTDHTALTRSWDDVAYVNAIIVDENGVPCPRANDEVAFSVTGHGAIAAVDSGDRASHEPFQAATRHAYQGQCIAILRATGLGPIKLTAAAPGLASGSATIAGLASTSNH